MNERVVVSPLSGRPSRFLFSERVLQKYQAEYYYDDDVGFIFVNSPHWLDEAYCDAIAITDTGVVARNRTNVVRITQLLGSSRLPFSKGVDVGAGYGLFVRGMRDEGYEFFWSDKYAKNLFARGFEAVDGTFDVAVAFEVLEHLENSAGFIADARKQFRFHTLFFSAVCFDPVKFPDRDWWYWSFETGQHISFFSERALKEIAKMCEMRLYHFGGCLYAFSDFDWSGQTGVYGRLIRKFKKVFGLNASKRTSLTGPDHIKMRDELRRLA